MGAPNLIAHIATARHGNPGYRAVVMAHPCSGTTWLCDTLATMGIVARHELVRPADPDWDVLVTYRQLGWREQAAERLWLVRNPYHTVESAAALFAKRPRVARDIWSQVVGSGFADANPLIGQAGPLFLAAWTWLEFNQRCSWRLLSPFRIEDATVPPPCFVPESPLTLDLPRRNPHRVPGGTPGMRFSDLAGFTYHDAIERLAARLGYNNQP